MGIKSLLLGALALIVLFIGFAGWQLWSSIGKTAAGDRLQRMRASAHYATDGFVNSLRVRSGISNTTMREFFFGSLDLREPQEPVPVVNRNREDFSVPRDSLRVTWLGHSTMLIEIDGKRILTDPVWGNRASPFSFLGPKRFFKPVLDLTELPPIDAVVLSHDHYDHLDRKTIKRLSAHVPLFITPLGVGARLVGWGVPESQIVELDWWDEHPVGNVRLVCTPARHFSGRFFNDRNATLWSGWAFVGTKHRAFFSGDSGMFPGYKEIGARLGPFDITMLDTGAYNTAWPDVHMGPEQAVEAHKLLGGEVLMPVHWATFNLSLHTWTAPMERILEAAQPEGVTVVAPRPGESVVAGRPEQVVTWWPELPYKTKEEFPIVSSQLER